MAIALIETGEVKQVWRDVGTLAELENKYGLSGANYRDLAGVVVGQIEQGGVFVNPPIPDVPAGQIRQEADDLLLQTDWVHLPDANVTAAEKNAILAFRLAVQGVSHAPRQRDLGFPPLENAFKRNGR